MKLTTTFLALLLGGVGFAMASAEDMKLHFPGQLMPRATLLNSNLMTFSGALGGKTAPAITQSTNSDREFMVEGNTFTSFKQAWKRSCDIQKNSCSDFANSSAGKGKVLVSECESQHTTCENAADTQTVTAFASLQTSDSEFDYYCES